LITKNGDFFENKIHYISAGAIALMINTFGNKDLCMTEKIFFVSSVFFFGTSLLLSMFSYVLAVYFQNRTLGSLINSKFNNKTKVDEKVLGGYGSDSTILTHINWLVFGLFFIGMISIFVLILI